MKTLLKSFCVLVTLVFLANISIAQDNNSTKNSDQEKRNTPYIPDNTPRAPVGTQNSIPFMTNCPPSENAGGICLKIPLDATFSVHLFDGLGCNAPASPTDPLQRNDDDVTLAIPLPFTFTLYGTPYTTVFINNNGNISFGADFCTFTPFGFPSTGAALVAPFFGDVDTRDTLSGVVWMKIEPSRMTVIWDRVGYYGVHSDKLNEFEVIISDGTDPLVGIGNNVCFSYNDMQWTTGDASGGIGGFFGSPATVGVNAGDGINFATLGRFDRPGTGYYGPGVDSNGVSYLDCSTFCFDASGAGNVCPIPAGFPVGPVLVSPGDVYHAVYSMLAPETSQITTGGVSGVPANMTVTITNGITATFDVTYDPSCSDSGRHVVCFTGIDNATDPCTTTVCVIFEVDCPLPVEMSSFTYAISGRDISLIWSTATEVNNSRFEIERSASNDWQQVGVVNGNGTTSTPNNYSFVDRGLVSGTYHYRLKQVDFNGNFTYHNLSNEVIIGVPTRFELLQNYPNPFNPATKIDYSIPYDGKVSLTIFDAMGREITKLVNGDQTAGYYSVNFNASSLASGIYYYRIEVSGSNNFVDSRKMLLVK
ncbi:MAG: nidogen-like domain-containing protein [Ignavibacteria bacterium]